MRLVSKFTALLLALPTPALGADYSPRSDAAIGSIRLAPKNALVASSIVLAPPIVAQQSPPSEREAMYNRYLEFASYVNGGSIAPHWMADGSSFWYAEGTPSNTVIWKVDAKANIKTALFDTGRLRKALTPLLGHEPAGSGVPFSEFEFLGAETAARFRLSQRDFVLDLTGYDISADSAAAKERERDRPRIVGRGFDGDIVEVLSPDRRWFAGVKDYNLWLRPADGGTSLQLTEDGVAEYAWDVEEAVWSADSKRIVATKIDGRGVAKIPIVDWLGVTEKVEWVQPHRPTSGGPLRRTELHVFDISSRQRARIGTGPEDQYIYTAGWRRDGSELMALQMSRNFKRLRLLAADPATGSIRVVLTETHKTFLWGNVFNYRGWREQGGLFTMLDDGQRFIWMSERDGWSHLYLYDLQGRQLRQLTRGSWPVQRLVAVDEKRGWVYFTAQGDPKRPYDTQVYRAGLEREALEPLASVPGRHDPVFSPSREYFLDTHSSFDRPPAVDLRRADGTLLQTLARADIEGLKTLRWAPPEEFTAKAADGSTDLYGVIHKPFDFDPERKYPVLEFIYAGPQTTHVPRTFDGSAFALTQLGFIVVMLDARGTPERGKKFQDVVYGNLGRHEIPDHVAALKQIAKRRPYMDMKRVGVAGRSYGGYFTTRAMLLAPDLYRVGVAIASGVEVYGHSSRVEPYLGLPSENPDAYEYASNLRLAGNLEGKLMLIHGTADINAPFSQTMKMAEALIRAKKPFDLLVLPGEGHFFAGEADGYLMEAMRRYLEEHLKPELTVRGSR